MFQYQCLNPIASVGLDQLGDQYDRTENFEDAQMVLVRSAVMHDLPHSDKLLAVARAGAGVNNIPLDKYASEGVVVFNTPGANAYGVKELVIAGMLLASRDIVSSINWVAENKGNPDIGKLAEKQKKQYAGTELKGKRLGVIGLGAIGRLVANTATHLGLEVYGHDPYLSVDAAWDLSRNIKHIKNVEQIYRECDFITIHVPLMDSTRGYIGKDAIDMMKSGVVVLNFARDVLVDEDAMLEALDKGKVRRYVSDFANAKTAGHDKCIVISHLGASTEESEDNCAVMAVKELKDYMENGNIVNSVNYPNCSMGVCTKAGRVALLHKNIANTIGQITSIFGAAKINISDMTNKSRNEYAYTLLDLETKATPEVIEKLKAIDGVIRVRVIV